MRERGRDGPGENRFGRDGPGGSREGKSIRLKLHDTSLTSLKTERKTVTCGSNSVKKFEGLLHRLVQLFIAIPHSFSTPDPSHVGAREERIGH